MARVGSWITAAVAAVASPLDAVLAGMIGAGLGIAAILAWLDLSRGALDDAIVRLGLRTPSDKKPRHLPAMRRNRAGDMIPYGWSDVDVRLLIAWRLSGVHPESIAQRLNRSPAAVRRKCRALGLPRPPRSALHRVDPGALDAIARAWWDQARPVAPRSSTDSCGTTAGAIVVPQVQPPRTTKIIIPDRVVDPSKSSPRNSDHSIITESALDPQPSLPLAAVQPDLGLPQIVPGALVPPAPSGHILQPPPTSQVPDRDRPRPVAANALLADLTGADDITRDYAAMMAVSRRYFGGQHYRAIARDIGMTNSALATLLRRIVLPRDLDRTKFSDSYDDDVAERTLAATDYELVRCDDTRRLFWRRRRHRAVIRTNRETRLASGRIGEYEKNRCENLIEIAKPSKRKKRGGAREQQYDDVDPPTNDNRRPRPHHIAAPSQHSN